ncbi:hypothetical protein IWX46DRAFT_584078 [Phyllosticta citricarpa]|uniref:Uncharacterized protein n=1 Tax=Phyllosticta citricarpa TaxID=55181 RepID=A0ABR1LLU1_9PEZI
MMRIEERSEKSEVGCSGRFLIGRACWLESPPKGKEVSWCLLPIFLQLPNSPTLHLSTLSPPPPSSLSQHRLLSTVIHHLSLPGPHQRQNYLSQAVDSQSSSAGRKLECCLFQTSRASIVLHAKAQAAQQLYDTAPAAAQYGPTFRIFAPTGYSTGLTREQSAREVLVHARRATLHQTVSMANEKCSTFATSAEQERRALTGLVGPDGSDAPDETPEQIMEAMAQHRRQWLTLEDPSVLSDSELVIHHNLAVIRSQMDEIFILLKQLVKYMREIQDADADGDSDDLDEEDDTDEDEDNADDDQNDIKPAQEAGHQGHDFSRGSLANGKA